MRRRPLMMIALPIVVVTALAALYLHQTPTVRGLVRYVAWRRLSPAAGRGNHAHVNGIRLYYEDHGSGPPVLVLHGGMGFVEMMGGQIRALAKQHRVIAVDDLTRPTQAYRFLPFIIDELRQGGIRGEGIKIVMAIGCHRPMLKLDQEKKLGKAITDVFGSKALIQRCQWHKRENEQSKNED